QILANGAGHEEPLVESQQSLPNDWSRDYLLYYKRDEKTKADLWVRDTKAGKEYPVVATEAEEIRGKFSPDGRSIAYVSDESGTNEIWVAPFTVSSEGVPSLGAGKRRISDKGGVRALWRRDGKELFYLSSDGKIMAVNVTQDSTFPYGTPHPL